MANYQSELTNFLQALKAAHPEQERKQREARAIWWDKSLDLEEQKRFAASRVRQAPYVYQTGVKSSD